MFRIRYFPDHATFSEKIVTTDCNLSLTLCNKVNFCPIQLVKYDVLEKEVKIMVLVTYMSVIESTSNSSTFHLHCLCSEVC